MSERKAKTWGVVVAAAVVAFLVGAIAHQAPSLAKLPGSSIKPNPGGGSSSGGTVTSVTATSPFVISSTPTTTPNVTSSGAGLSLLGRSANSTGVLDMITCASDGGVFRRSGTTVACGTIAAATSVTGLATVATSGLASDLTGTLAAGRLPALTGDVTSSAGSATTTIATAAVSLAKMADLATARFVGRTTAGTGVPEALTGTQATAMLDAATTSLPGLMSATDKTYTNYLTGSVGGIGWCLHQWNVAKTVNTQLTDYRCKHFDQAPSGAWPTTNNGAIDGGGMSPGSGAALYIGTVPFQSQKTKQWALSARAKFNGPTSGKISEFCMFNSAGTKSTCWGNLFSVDATHYTIRSVADSTTFGTSTGVADNSIHDFMGIGDETNAKLYVDGSYSGAQAALTAWTADEPVAPAIFNTTSGDAVVSDVFWAWE
jgi:hypothetical protein